MPSNQIERRVANPGRGGIVASRRECGEVSSSLDRYLAESQAYPLLSSTEEVACAERIEQLEIEHWGALLEYSPALDTIVSVLKSHVRPPKRLLALRRVAGESGGLDALRQRQISLAAAQLRAADVRRNALAAVDAEVVQHFEGNPAARRYLARVRKARQAQQRAKNDFMAANLRLVVAHARRYDSRLMPLADLVQEGNFGLLRAVERFDHRRGFRFSTYASWWIRHALNRALSDRGRLIRVPVHLLEDVQRAARVRSAELAQNGEAPSADELAAKLGLREDKLALIEGYAGTPPASLNQRVTQDGDATLLEVVADTNHVDPDDALDLARWRAGLKTLLGTLSPMEAAILRYRFGLEGGEELTLQQIGEKYNLSRERIRQLQELALAKLRGVLAARATDDRGAA